MDEKKSVSRPDDREDARRAYVPPELKKFAPIKKATGQVYYVYYYVS